MIGVVQRRFKGEGASARRGLDEAEDMGVYP